MEISLQPTQEVAQSPDKVAEKQKLKKATQDFEAFFLQSIWKAMRKTVGQGIKSKTSESRLYTEMMDEVFANNMSKTNKFGLGDVLYKTLEKSVDAVILPASDTDKKV
ncbi:MAG: rod-binding protein [bacterium]|jgi:flagellar protein FlgJ